LAAAPQAAGHSGWLITKQFVDQLVTGYDAVGIAQQQREQGTLLRPADPHHSAAPPDLERPEDSKLQTTAHVTALGSVPKSRGLGQFSAQIAH
jgi:hypothetical protein